MIKLPEKIKKNGQAYAEFFSVFVLIVLRYVYCGFRYFPQLDDYIQYYNYASSDNRIAVVMNTGMLGARPLAGVADIWFWSLFWGCMILAVLLISAMYASSAVLLRRILSRHFDVGPVFLVVMTLLPLNMEGSYWLSASSRTVCGMFFGVLSAWFLQKFFDCGKRRYIAPFAVLQLVAMSLYEQSFLFAAGLCAMLVALNFKKVKARVLPALFTFSNAAIYFVFTRSFAKASAYTSRISTQLPITAYYYKSFLPSLFRKIGRVFVKGGVKTTFAGFVRGVNIIFADVRTGSLAFLSIVIVAVGIFAAICIRGKDAAQTGAEGTSGGNADLRRTFVIPLLCSIWLVMCPLAVFFIMTDPYIALRNAVPCLPGVALLCDCVIMLVFRRAKHRTVICTAIASILAFVCVIACVSEITDYKNTYLDDRDAVEAIYGGIPKSDLFGGKKIGILNLEKTYIRDQVFRHEEHVQGVTNAGWALSAAVVQYANENFGMKSAHTNVVPLPFDTPLYEAWNREANKISSFDDFYLYDKEQNRLIHVSAESVGDGEYVFTSDDGVPMATVRDIGGKGYGERIDK